MTRNRRQPLGAESISLSEIQQETQDLNLKSQGSEFCQQPLSREEGQAPDENAAPVGTLISACETLSRVPS